MFERYLLNAERHNSFFKILFVTFFITIILAIINFLIAGVALFLVALISLALSYSVVNYIRSMDKEELEKQMKYSALIRRHERELIVFWAIFIGVVFGMIVSSPLITDFTYQENFLQSITGDLTAAEGTEVSDILLNNLEVAFITFIISFLMFSGLIFILVWNASIVAHYLISLGSYKLALSDALFLLSYGLLEIGGYVLIGIMGSITAYKFDRSKKFNHKMDREFIMDMSYLFIGSIIMLFLAATIEGL